MLLLEYRSGFRQQCLLPLTDLDRMNPVLLSNLIDGLDPTNCLKGYLGLELWRMSIAFLLCH